VGFGDRVLAWPVPLRPVGVTAGNAGSTHMSVPPIRPCPASAAITANGFQGIYLHIRGVAARREGRRMAHRARWCGASGSTGRAAPVPGTGG